MSEQEMTKADNRQRYIELGYNIAYYRKHAGLTQEQLAEKAGISRPHMGAIEAPNLCRPISLELLFNLADALASSRISCLSSGTGNKQAAPAEFRWGGLYFVCFSYSSSTVSTSSIPLSSLMTSSSICFLFARRVMTAQ